MKATESDHEVASKLRLNHGAIHYQFKQLCLVFKLFQWVLHDLNHDQKKRKDSGQQLFSLHRTLAGKFG